MKTSLFVLLAACGSPSYSPPGVSSNFSFYEGSLDGWTVDAGTVQPASTWDKTDVGVALVGDNVQISEPITLYAGCIDLQLATYVEASAEAEVALDWIGADGSLHDVFVRELPTANWERFEYAAELQLPDNGATPALFFPLALVFRKTGSGRVIFADLDLTNGCENSEAFAPAVLTPVDDGAGDPCTDSSQCTSGLSCIELAPDLQSATYDTRECAECATDADCMRPRICIPVQTDSPNPVNKCLLPAPATFGEACETPGQCVTGSCDGQCIECDFSDVPHSLCSSPAWQLNGNESWLGNFCNQDIACPNGETCVGEAGVGLCAAGHTRCTNEHDCVEGDSCAGIGTYAGRCESSQ